MLATTAASSGTRLDEVFGLFDRDRAGRVPVRVAIQAAEALGQAGDPRLTAAERAKNWITIPAGEFLMGSQKQDPGQPAFDAEMYDDEGPVHKVWLDEFCIAKYPVTVAEFAKFVEQDGCRQERWWAAGGFGHWTLPDDWDEQLQHPNRPVVVELKAKGTIHPVDKAQTLSHLRLLNLRIGLLINFHEERLVDERTGPARTMAAPACSMANAAAIEPPGPVKPSRRPAAGNSPAASARPANSGNGRPGFSEASDGIRRSVGGVSSGSPRGRGRPPGS